MTDLEFTMWIYVFAFCGIGSSILSIDFMEDIEP